MDELSKKCTKNSKKLLLVSILIIGLIIIAIVWSGVGGVYNDMLNQIHRLKRGVAHLGYLLLAHRSKI